MTERNANRLTVACVQMRSGATQSVNIASMQEMVREAASRGADYVQTPEMTGLVQRRRKELMAEIEPDDGNSVFAAASELAGELGIWLHVGSAAVATDDGRAANRAALFSPRGERVATYDKIHMFDVDLDNGERWRESSVYKPGNICVTVPGMPIHTGLAICFDVRFPGLYRAQANRGALMLTCPSCFTRQTGEAHWHVLLRARAIENGAFVVAAAQGGKHEDGRESYGHSLIIDPWGRILAEKDDAEPGVILHEIDPEKALEARRKIPVIGNEREFGLEDAESGSGHGDRQFAAGMAK